MRNVLTWLIVFILGLLIGFVPQYWKAHGLREQLASCHTKTDLAKVQQSAALTYVAATQLNYGVASGYAQTFFANAQSVQATTPDAAIKDVLNQILSARDKITADLAKGSPEVVGELQPLVLKIEQAGE
jgi:predicted negative regulator of RcsB-dependent stress response